MPESASRSIANFEIFAYIPIECVVASQNFYHNLLLKTLGPLVFLGLLWLRPLWLRWTLAEERQVKKVTSQMTKWTLMALELILPSVTTTIANTFACTRFDSGDYLIAQLTLPCDNSANRRMWTCYAVVMMIV